MRVISLELTGNSPILIKCMKLTAADQMREASMQKKPVPQDVKVFVNLANKGKTCWSVLLGKSVCTELDVQIACKVERVDVGRWLGVVQERRKVGKISERSSNSGRKRE
jgi:hypothetical protein